MIKDKEVLKLRAEKLKAAEAGGLNGIELVFVKIEPPGSDVPNNFEIIVHFFNDNHLKKIEEAFGPNQKMLEIEGGKDNAAGRDASVRVVSVKKKKKALKLTIMNLDGDPNKLFVDYSTYTLKVEHEKMDPFFKEVDFKFRPGCFNNCSPEWEPAPEPRKDPVIDYLAKDFDSFRHTMIAAMAARVPGWEPTSEADLDQVILELVSAAADELSDLQDRVINEAYLATARKRVSLARHARLMDYHIHQGNQASTWLAFEVDVNLGLLQGFQVATADPQEDPEAVVFTYKKYKDKGEEGEEKELSPLLNRLGLYTWPASNEVNGRDTVTALEVGSTTADLCIPDQSLAGSAAKDRLEEIKNKIKDKTLSHLLIQEHLGPEDGTEAGRDPTKRQILEFYTGDEPGASDKAPEVIKDPVTENYFLRVHWRERDRLRHNYCFVISCKDNDDGGEEVVRNVSMFHANLVRVYQGAPRAVDFIEKNFTPVAPLPLTYPQAVEQRYERGPNGEVLLRLPDARLAYRETEPGGEEEPRSTLEVMVDGEEWKEVANLIHSDGGSQRGSHFVVETDEEGRGLIRFGDGVNGRKLPDKAVVRCKCQVGGGLEGNVGADSLDTPIGIFSGTVSCWNPLDVTNGRAPEPRDEIIRRVPEAYRRRQLRAVTLDDYVRCAEKLPGVSRAAAEYAWTGSWRSVRLTVDPAGRTDLAEELTKRVRRQLNPVRLIGEDLEIRGPVRVPLDIKVWLCLNHDFWAEDVRYVLEQEFSEGYTPDGRMAFFHPDLWTFGEALHASRIIGRAQSVKGVDHVIKVEMKRFSGDGPSDPEVVTVRHNEIIQVASDRNNLEDGFIRFEIKGGRR